MSRVKRVDGGTNDEEYRYEHFTTKLLSQDLRFHSGSLGPGDALARHELITADGGAITVGGQQGRPMLLMTGSTTCPMTASAMPSLQHLHKEFGGSVDFVMVYVREAHPGENFTQSRSLQEKCDHARALRGRYDVPFTVAVDGVDGELHRLLDGKPNAAFLMDASGTVVFRSHWASDERRIREALESVARGKAPKRRQSRAMLGPVARAMGWSTRSCDWQVHGRSVTCGGARSPWPWPGSSPAPSAASGRIGPASRRSPPSR